MSNRTYHVVMNARSGAVIGAGLTPEGLAGLFAEAGHQAVIDAEGDDPLDKRIARALASKADILVAAGGDGTVTAVAGAVLETGRTMAVLPLGTANLLARDLGIPLDLKAWMAGLGAMQPQQIDVGLVNGRLFLHKVAIGIIPRIAAARERLRGRSEFPAAIGLARYCLRLLRRARRLQIEITSANGPTRLERVKAMAVANNAYDEGLGRFFSRSSLDAGKLTLYVLKRLDASDMLRLAAEMLIGRWRRDEVLTITTTDAVTVRSRARSLEVMIDGEVEQMPTPLQFRIRPRALTVLAPPLPAEAATDAEAETDVEAATDVEATTDADPPPGIGVR